MTENFLFQLMSFQRLNKAPLESWVIARISAQILSEHYNCMAGLAEVCTHVSSLLFCPESSIKMSTVRERAAYWVAPSNPSHL